MEDYKEMIAGLQAIVTGLSAQSFGHRLHSHIFASQGFAKLGQKYADHADEEMGFTEQFIDRIIDLGGVPKLEAQPAAEVYEDIEDYLRAEEKVSVDGIALVAKMMPAFEGDFVTYDMVKDYLKDEDDDLQETRQELDLIGYVGKQNWLAQQM